MTEVVIWTLILVIHITGLVKGVDYEAVATFKSQEACEATAEQFREIHLKLRDKALIALCVPDTLELEENRT